MIARTGRAKVLPVEGELFTIEVARSWIFGHTRYVKGTITSAWFDLARLELPPLQLFPQGLGDPAAEEWGEDLPDEIAEILLMGSPREDYEMEQVLPADGVMVRFEEDPIVVAAELMAAGYSEEAADLLGELLTID
ncbi:MAG: hypothetical protein V3T72_13920, partial [Thermoanaerobaculia bacterium]